MYVSLQHIKRASSSARAHEHNLNVIIKDGVIEAVGAGLPPLGRVIDCRGLTLLPGFVDLHAHFRDPGFEYKEDIASGSRAAAHGGYTTVHLMANTRPVCSDMAAACDVVDRAAHLGICDVLQSVSITKDFDGKTLSHLDGVQEPVRFLSDDGFGVQDSAVMLAAMQKANALGLGLMLHEEDSALTHVDSYAMEDVMTYRDLRLAEITGARVHFCHVSTEQSLAMITEAKQRGVNVTCEVAPHHLIFTEELGYNVAPPLRSAQDRDYLVRALSLGVVDAIATDHAPHSRQDKENGANGITGLDFAFPSCYTYLVRTGKISLQTLSALMSTNPAAVLGLGDRGEIEPGMRADFALADLDCRFTVREEDFFSKSANTPLIGRELYGKIRMTIKQGEIVYEDFN